MSMVLQVVRVPEDGWPYPEDRRLCLPERQGPGGLQASLPGRSLQVSQWAPSIQIHMQCTAYCSLCKESLIEKCIIIPNDRIH